MENIHVQQRRLNAALDEVIGEHDLGGLPSLCKTASPKKKTEWAQAVCKAMESKFDSKTRQDIRSRCACGPSQKQMNDSQKIFKNSKNDNDFARRITEYADGAFSVEYADGAFTHIYPRCYCGMVNKAPDNMTDTWCLCTIGYTERLYSFALGEPVKAEIVESLKMGGKCCRIKFYRESNSK